MKTFATLNAAMKRMPNALRGTSCDDPVGIEAQAKRDAEKPLAILRDLVRVELDLIDEGESDYGPQQKKWIRTYWERLCASL